jgi:hypothetical protein
MKLLFIIIWFLFSSINLYYQKVFEIYREDFNLFFSKKQVNSKYDVVSLVDSLPKSYEDGIYHFYDVPIKDSVNKKMFTHIYGTYQSSKKEGEFVCEKFQYNKKIKSYEIQWQQVITYHEGKKNGCHKEYYMSYQYNRQKELLNELATMTVYIEYTENEYDGFYMIITDYSYEDSQSRAGLMLKYYEKGVLTKTMHCDGLGKESIYHNLGFD